MLAPPVLSQARQGEARYKLEDTSDSAMDAELNSTDCQLVACKIAPLAI